MKLYIAGRRGAGKTTAATILQRQFGARVARITEPLYDLARTYFGMIEKDRLLLQRLGDAFRAVDPAWLARYAAQRLEAEAQPGQLLVIEGVRTSEEATWLNEHGWIGIRIEADDEIRLARRVGEPVEVDNHHTETAVDRLPVHAVVRNNGTKTDLASALSKVRSQLTSRLEFLHKP